MTSLSSRLRSALGAVAISAAAVGLPAYAGSCGPKGACGAKQEQLMGGCGAGTQKGCCAAKPSGGCAGKAKGCCAAK